MKTKTLNQVGYVISGEVLLNLWGGSQGTVPINEQFLPIGKLTHKNVLYSVNDGGFGCESIASAMIEIYELYENGYREYNRTIETDSHIHAQDFNNWNQLRKNLAN